MTSGEKHFYTAEKMNFSITDFFSNCDEIGSLLRIWSHLLKIFVMENLIFSAVLWHVMEQTFNYL